MSAVLSYFSSFFVKESIPCSVFVKFVFYPGKKAEFVELLKGEEGLVLTRKFPGFISLECYDDLNDTEILCMWQKWNDRSDHEAYLQMRKETGLLDVLKASLSEPLSPVYLTYDKSL